MTHADWLRAVAQHQSVAHGAGHDHVPGSPHLRHAALHSRVVTACRSVVADVLRERGSCRVLEIGAGHGVFTDHLAALGAEVWVTEMSRASVDVLRSRFSGYERVHVVHDEDGTGVARGPEVDVVLYISVLHHIPDYLGAVTAVLDRVAPGGAFVSFQDPLWYPRRSRTSLLADRGAYLLWRLTRGNLRRGVASMVRRARGAYDLNNPSDTVEYHVVRDGVDEQALMAVLEPRFATVDLHRYWSTQARWLQWLGERIAPANTFGVVATGGRP
ncbi:methyltransferase family protein [Lentzea atacamensis]|uniref:Methyltransferase family protein n=1 Tax=Lentzea atacamensis TaxID=531938 RepID=A0A316I8M9_9PSEU|nr:class I SAM-dependent methyltransferase [Lentzea atacamensis]PWK89571.1 methyltransferase family protein [Lentzea atacamensis]RAS60649.1 methyltransferase family protein [Lentzea atacamensis]